MNPYQQSQIQRIDRTIDALHIERQRVTEHVPTVAFQGAFGAFSEDAALLFCGTTSVLRPCPTLADVFRAVADGVADLAVVPVANTLAGKVPGCADLLRQHNVHIVEEERLLIQHMLIGAPGSTMDSIRIATSHPVALAQCSRFFEQHPHIVSTPAFDTAGAVAATVASGALDTAAIGSARSASLYGGKILMEHLEDRSDNYTTFVLLAPGRA